VSYLFNLFNPNCFNDVVKEVKSLKDFFILINPLIKWILSKDNTKNIKNKKTEKNLNIELPEVIIYFKIRF
jgi:hypothetical protein